MPRPRAPEPRRKITIHIPESLMRRVEKALDDGALGRRRKHGDFGATVSVLLLRWLDHHEEIVAYELEELL